MGQVIATVGRRDEPTHGTKTNDWLAKAIIEQNRWLAEADREEQAKQRTKDRQQSRRLKRSLWN